MTTLARLELELPLGARSVSMAVFCGMMQLQRARPHQQVMASPYHGRDWLCEAFHWDSK